MSRLIPRFKWMEGRQKSSYSKMLFGQGHDWDLWLLRFNDGSHVPEHTDPVKDNEKHYRLNIVIKSASGGFFDGKSFFNLFNRIIFFRPDIWPHSMTKIYNGNRYMLSFGFVLKGNK